MAEPAEQPEQQRHLLDHDLVHEVDGLDTSGGGLHRAPVDDDPRGQGALGRPHAGQRDPVLPAGRVRRWDVLDGELDIAPPATEHPTEALRRVDDEVVEGLGAGRHRRDDGVGQGPAQAPATTITMTAHPPDRRWRPTAWRRTSRRSWPSLHG